MPKPKRIILIRHGQSQSNVDYRVRITVPDHKIELSPKGRQQAITAGVKLKKKIGEEKIAAYVSPYYRTRQTADGVLSKLPKKQLYLRYEDPRIREQEAGNFLNPADWERISNERKVAGIFFYRRHTGESGADVYDRASTFLETLYRDFQKPDFPDNVLIVSHGLTIRLLLMRWLHWSVEHFESTKNLDNCQMVEMRLQKDGRYKLSRPFSLRRK
jgi:broad specificity phosphatase PhoE